MSEIEYGKMMLIFAASWFIVAIISFIFLNPVNWAPIVSASFILLGIACIGVWLINRKKKRSSSFMKKGY
ncbi:MAG: hypothetical protein IAX21_04240 [Candidatus Bathyarchaeota archaeon]|nr:hypothetical protein [Candidatus Bathyarchaeum tardum]WGM89834.1 MAG: hypothetical protein NUK63_01540 [Candidatus Bathyarchaeum tardum]WNZ30069.1 MAG: hypothetical protein IAX21_04240 [Candidatus Bathyarchaeota archaeon]